MTTAKPQSTLTDVVERMITHHYSILAAEKAPMKDIKDAYDCLNLLRNYYSSPTERRHELIPDIKGAIHKYYLAHVTEPAIKDIMLWKDEPSRKQSRNEGYLFAGVAASAAVIYYAARGSYSLLKNDHEGAIRSGYGLGIVIGASLACVIAVRLLARKGKPSPEQLVPDHIDDRDVAHVLDDHERSIKAAVANDPPA